MPNVQSSDTDFQGFGSTMFLESKTVTVYQILWKQKIQYSNFNIFHKLNIIYRILSMGTQDSTRGLWIEGQFHRIRVIFE